MNAPERPPWEAASEIEMPVTSRTRRLADTLFARIVSGEYDYGTRLPAERALSEEHGLSRNTIRQALGLMEHYGVVQRRASSGSVVCYRSRRSGEAQGAPPPEDPETLDLREIREVTSPLELGVVRSIVEPEIARLAVLNMTSRDIGRLNAIQGRIEMISVDGEKFSALDDELRMQLAQGTHNPLLIAIYTMVNLVSRNASWSVRRRNALTPARIGECKLQNRALCEAIENRNIETAVEYLKLSLADFHQDLLRGV